MKKFVLKLVLFLIVILNLPNTINAAINPSNELKEFNWYFRRNKDHTPPPPPSECSDFLSKYDAYHLGDTNNKVLYLTFDEGYEREGNTSSILNVLKSENVPAAFFVVRPYITDHPELIRRMVNEGHLVCNHSSHHPSMASIKDTEKFKKEFTEVEEAFKDLTGTDMPKFFRPPMGKFSVNSLKQTKELGYKTIFWSFAYQDWLPDKQPTLEYGKKKIIDGAHPGGIILLHAVSDTNCKILEDVIKTLKEEGYKFKSLNDL